MSFWGELKRRNVYKVGAAYAIVAWLIVQAAAIVFPHLDFPEWTVPFVIVLLIIGFPLILLFAWAFEVTPEGLKRTKKLRLSQNFISQIGKVTGESVLGAAQNKLAEPVVTDVEKGSKTIAIVPFVNLSSDPEQEYFVDGLSEELLDCLSHIPDLRVTARTSSFSFKGSNKTVKEIASVLGVEHILEGSVRKASNALRITAQLVRAADGFHLWSKTYDRELKDIFAVQEDIATAVANELKATLGIGKSFKKQLGGTENVEAYEHYLIAKGQNLSNNPDILKLALESIDEAIKLDPEFPLAWAYRSDFHSLFAIFGSPKRAASELDFAQEAAERAIQLAPNLAEAYGSLGLLKVMKGDLVEAELAYRKAIELAIGPLSGNKEYIAIFYIEVGLFKKANKLFKEVLLNDPLNKDVRSNYLLCLGFLGDMQRADEEYKRGKALAGGQWYDGDFNNAILHLVPGDFDLDAVLTIFNYNIEPKENIESPEEGLSVLRQIYFKNENISSSHLMAISVAAAYFGDYKLSMDAIEKSASITAAGTFHIWLPVMKEVRKTQRFKNHVKKIGLVDYWNKFGWPDICHQLDNGDFECD